jgi:hypothetical protein
MSGYEGYGHRCIGCGASIFSTAPHTGHVEGCRVMEYIIRTVSRALRKGVPEPTTPQEVTGAVIGAMDRKDHSPACNAAYTAWGIMYALWVRDWPNHCRTCKGVGGAWYSYGGTLEDPPDLGFDPCSACIVHGYCPRCSAYDENLKWAVDPVEFKCLSCDWNAGAAQSCNDPPPGMIAPAQPPCYCGADVGAF